MSFETGPDGNITCAPLVEYETASAFGTAILARLGCARSEAEFPPHGKPTNYQIVPTPAQARALAQDLTAAAVKLETQQSPARPS